MKFIKKNKIPIAVAIIYGFLMIFFKEIGLLAFKNSLYYLVEMIQIMPVIFFITASIEVLVAKEMIIKNLGKNSGLLGGVLSLVLGSISAGPIYAAFPIAKMLLSKGASIGNVVIILSSWAVIKVPMLANEIKFLGVSFMVTRWILTVVVIFTMAWIIQGLMRSENN